MADALVDHPDRMAHAVVGIWGGRGMAEEGEECEEYNPNPKLLH